MNSTPDKDFSRKPTRVVKVEPTRVSPGSTTARKVERVEQPAAVRQDRILWVDRGWRQVATGRGDEFMGSYLVRLGGGQQLQEFPGRIERHGSGNTRAYVHNPPQSLLTRHPVHPCIHAYQGGWYWMNWHAGTHDIDRTIGYMEKILSESVALEADR